MLFAFWRMRSTNDAHRRYINARIYERMRYQFGQVVGSMTAKTQRGKANSHFGTKWYTNYITGESKIFRTLPVEKEWVAGRNAFRGQTVSIKNKILKYIKDRYQSDDDLSVVHPDYRVYTKGRRKYKKSRVEIYLDAVKRARRLWDQYHSGTYSKLEDFSTELQISKVALYHCFKKFIPKYTIDKTTGKRTHYASNLSLVGRYT